jgi:hypothetical protein
LRQEFSERVSKKRKLLLYSKLSDALKHFAVTVSKQEEDAESELLTPSVIELSKAERSPNALWEMIRSLRIERLAIPAEVKDPES